MLPGTVLRMREELPALNEEDAASSGLGVGDPNPWNLVRVVATIDHGADAGGICEVVQTVEFCNWSSPIEISADKLDELGYEVIHEGEDGPWTTPDDELVQPARSAAPQYGQPGWAAAIRKRDEEAKNTATAAPADLSARGAAARDKAEERKAALRAPKGAA